MYVTSRERSTDKFTAHIKNNAEIPGPQFEYNVMFVPLQTLACEEILEDEGVLGDPTIGEFPLHFIPLEPDLLSLELEDAFEELYLVHPP